MSDSRIDIEPHEAAFILAAIDVARAASAAHAGDPPSEAEIGRLLLAFGSALGAMGGPAGLAQLGKKLAVVESG